MRIRALLTLAAVIGAGFGLRWVTAGSLVSVSRDDLASLAVLTVSAVAWCAYAWLALVTAATALEQLPGAVGQAAGAIAAGLTSAGSRALLRSALGVAAVTPLTVGLAHASPSSWTAAPHPAPAGLPAYGDLGVEPISTVDLATSTIDRARARSSREDSRAAYLGVERASTVGPGDGRSGPGVDGRVVVPDRPTIGAPTRYTPIRTPRRVVVRPGDTLWSIARAELGPTCSDQAIATRWPDWYGANAAVIGPDPDHLEPGQVLQQPSPSAEVLRLPSISPEN